MYNQISSWHGIAYFFMHEINLQVYQSILYHSIYVNFKQKKEKRKRFTNET